MTPAHVGQRVALATVQNAAIEDEARITRDSWKNVGARLTDNGGARAKSEFGVRVEGQAVAGESESHTGGVAAALRAAKAGSGILAVSNAIGYRLA